MSKLTELGFKGDIRFIHNEEGSGARYYKSSVYYPDSLTDPVTNSGITIDPGVDLANANKRLIDTVLNIYASADLLTAFQLTVLRDAVGLKKYDAIDWLLANRTLFKNKFFVPPYVALDVMENYTAVPYWKAIAEKMPELLKIKNEVIALAVHTSLLSMAYNRGHKRTIKDVADYVSVRNWDGLAKKISRVHHAMKALRDRRKREAKLIEEALEKKNNFTIELTDINPAPLTVIPVSETELVIEKLNYKVKRPEINE
ncbi:MAG: hypothetical protein Kow0098_03650 [Ignavibacteriaceae bacterium]